MNNTSMLRYSLYAVLVSILYVSCKPAATESETATADTTVTTDTQPQCFQYASEYDTVSLQLLMADNGVTGTLLYKLKEKDANTGILQGRMQGDLLIAEYNFQSEGQRSVRQVAFRKSGDTWVEGYGPVQERDGKMVFTQTDSLTFLTDRPLVSVPCP